MPRHGAVVVANTTAKAATRRIAGERLAVQIDGAHHVGPQRSEDIRHDAALMLLGYHVIRVSYGQVMHGWPEVQEQIMQAVAQGLHRA